MKVYDFKPTKKFLKENTIDLNTSNLLEVINIMDSPSKIKVRISPNYIMIEYINLSSTPSTLMTKSEFCKLQNTKRFKWNAYTIEKWNELELTNFFYKNNLPLKVYPMVDDAELLERYIKNNTKGAIKKYVKEFSFSGEETNEYNRMIASEILILADLGLIKEVSYMNNVTYEFVEIKVKNENFIPILNVLDIPSPVYKEREELEYKQYFLTYPQLEKLLLIPDSIESKGTKGIFHYNSFLQQE